MKKLTILFSILFFCLSMTVNSQFIPFAVTDQTPTAPLSNPTPSSFQPRYISGFGVNDVFTVFFEDRDNGQTISFASTTTGPNGFPASVTSTNIAPETHFCVKDWPITIGATTYNYRAWGSVGNNMNHRFYVSNDLVNWTTVSTFQITNDPGFTNSRGWVYYGFHDVILLNGTYYAFAESNQSQTMICRSVSGDDVWEAFAAVGGSQPGDGPLGLPSGVTFGWTPSGSFVDLGNDRGYGKIYADPRDSDFYLAINTAAIASLPPATLEAAFINPSNWTWYDGSTGPAAAPILSETAEHDLRECWVVPNTDPDADWVIVYDADFGSGEGGKALGWATLTPPLGPPNEVWVDDNYDPSTPGWGYDHFDVIQDGIDAVTDGGTVNVDDGTYNENILLNKNLTLISVNGLASTTIQGSSGGGNLGTIHVNAGNTVQIGDSGQGFSIIGYDGPTPGLEHACIYFQGSNSNSIIRANDLVADGEACLLTEHGATIDGLIIDDNIFSGKTFTSTHPAGEGFSAQFTLANVPRSLVSIAGGTKQNIQFTDNEITGVSGGCSITDNSGNPAPSHEQGNTQITLDGDNITVTGNSFSGTTTRYASALRARGATATYTITGNTFDGINPSYFYGGNDPVIGPARATAVFNNNTFADPGTFVNASYVIPPGYAFPCDADEVVVDDDWTGLSNGSVVTYNGSPWVIGINAFAVIQDGVDAVNAGGTVYVAAGTYSESNINITKALTLSGPNAGIPYDGTRTAEAIIEDTKIEFSNGLDGVIFDGLMVTGAPPTGNIMINLSSKEVSNFSIENCVIENIEANVLFSQGGNIRDGIIVNETKISGVGNGVDGTSPYSALNTWQCSNVTITNCLIEDIDYNGLNLETVDGAVVTGNVFRRIGKSGIQIANLTDGPVTIYDNTFERCNRRYNGWGYNGEDFAPMTTNGTSVGDFNFWYSAIKWYANGNEITATGSYSITGNTLDNCVVGYLFARALPISGGPSIVFQENIITNNSLAGFLQYRPGGASHDLRYNYWGAPEGPDKGTFDYESWSTGEDPANYIVYEGISAGDAIVVNFTDPVGFTYSPWYTDPGMQYTSNIDIGLYHTTCGDFEVRVRPFSDITDLYLTNLVFAVKWEGATSLNLENVSSDYQVFKAYDAVDGNAKYSVFIALPIDLTVNWTAGTEYVVCSFSHDQSLPGSYADFEIADDTWAQNNNAEYYIEIDGLDNTGLIYQDAPNVFLGSCDVLVKAFLQGPYNVDNHNMNADLCDSTDFPLTQPYDVAPWSYAGTEAISAPVSDVVDWVLVELRSGADPASATLFDRRAALLLQDGTIAKHDDLSAGIVFDNMIAEEDYYIVVWHRNHMPVLSGAAVTLPNTVAYDFTEVTLTTPYKHMDPLPVENEPETGVWALIAGDINSDGMLKYSGADNDRALIILRIFDEGGTLLNHVASGYFDEDVTMNYITRYTGGGNDRDKMVNSLKTASMIPYLNAVYFTVVPDANFTSKDAGSGNGPLNIRMSETSGALSVGLEASEQVEGTIDNVQFTLVWNSEYTEIEQMIQQSQSLYGIAPQGPAIVKGGMSYQVFVGVTPFGFSGQNDFFELVRLPKSNDGGVSPQVQIADDETAFAINGDFYVSVWGRDMTGQIQSTKLGAEEMSAEAIRIYPNPVSDGTLNILLPGVSGQEVQITLTGMQGQVVLEQNCEAEGLMQLDVSNLNGGVYLLKVEGENGVHNSRVVIR